MGIRGLFGVIKQLPGSSRVVNIVEELQKFQNGKAQKPVIVMNLWTLSNHFFINTKDKCFGGRLNQIRSEFEDFLIALRENGAELIFLFKWAAPSDSEFFENIERTYKDGCEILDVIQTFKSTESIAKHFENRLRQRGCSFEFALNYTVMMVLTQTASKYGKLRGITFEGLKKSTVHVQIANESQAMALMGTDTHYIFHKGSWKFWSDKTLDMKNMTITEFNKEIVLDKLGIPFENVKLFVALTGALDSSDHYKNKCESYFSGRYKRAKETFKNVAAFVKRNPHPITDEALNEIARQIFGRTNPELRASFRQTFDAFDPDQPISQPKADDKIENVYKSSYLNLGDQILKNKPIFISPVGLDLRCKDMGSLESLVTPWIQKTAGIMLKHRDDQEQRILFVKNSHENLATQIEIDILFPDFDVPSLNDLIFGEVSNESALEMLLWILDLKISPEVLEGIPDENMAETLILFFLIKKKSLEMFEATSILRTIVDVKKGKVESTSIQYPELINARALRVSILFTKLYYFLHSCLGAIGIKAYENDFLFDNVYFQKLFAEEPRTVVPDDNIIIRAFKDIINN